jgi:hypothetical protein
MPNHILTFEIGKDAEELFIHGDETGLRLLAKVASHLADDAAAGKKEHTHLMTEDWAGNELSSEKQGTKEKLLHSVTIHAWPKKS